MSQQRIAEGVDTEDDFGPVHFYYKEIQADTLNNWTLESESRVSNIHEVINGLDRQTSTHPLSELDIDDNPEMFVDTLLDSYPDHNETFCKSLINDFSDSMRTSAREEGKYAVLILYENSLVICHTDSEELTITKDAEVLERLLDTDNVDKYARFQRTDDETEVLSTTTRLTQFRLGGSTTGGYGHDAGVS